MSVQAERPSGGVRVAVIGLGSMGFGMATSLRRAGFDVAGFDVDRGAVERFATGGGRGAATPAEAVDGVAAVVSVVVNAAQTEAVLFGPDGVAAAMPEGAVFISSAGLAAAGRAPASASASTQASIATSARMSPASCRAGGGSPSGDRTCRRRG